MVLPHALLLALGGLHERLLLHLAQTRRQTSHNNWGSCDPYPPGGPIGIDTPLERSSIRLGPAGG
eukprot:6374154-Pyramimonas_sp.AAC.1